MSSSQLRRHYTAIALGGLATIGLWEGAKGVLLPHFLADLSLLPAVGAAIFSGSAIGSFIGSSSFGALSSRVGLRTVSGLGAILVALAVLLIMAVRSPAVLYAGFLAYGLGISLIELSTHLPISVLYSEQQGGVLNLLHGFFGVGALAGSAVGAAMLTLGGNWRLTVLLVGACLALWVIYFRSLPAVPLPRHEDQRGGYGILLKDPLVWAALLALVAAVVGEIGCGLWLPSYLQQVKGMSEGASAMGSTAFFMGFTATRLAGPWMVGRLGNVRAIIATALVGAAGLAGVLLLPGSWFWLSALAGGGVAIAFATCLTLVATRHPDRVNTVFAIMYSGGGLAGIGTGPAMGWIAQRAGLGAAMAVPFASYLLIIVLLGFYGWAGRPLETAGRSVA